MNENLNLVEILKDCPKGTKLYSTAFGDVYFYRISNNEEYPIGIAVAGNSDYRTLTCDGKLWRDYGGECILFPSKEQRDWSKFKPKQYRLAPISEFKDGDILATNSGLQVFILEREKNDEEGSCYIGYSSGLNDIFFCGEFKFARFATEEEKQKLFDAIKERGYRWNAETKTLEKLVKPKFDPNTLQPFDKVLIRDAGYDRWTCNMFSHIDNKLECNYVCGGFAWKYCIPYNEDTKHLVGTDDEAPEYYRYWED